MQPWLPGFKTHRWWRFGPGLLGRQLASRATSNVPHGLGMNVFRGLLSYPGVRKSVSKAIPVV